jgi:hypothetical protein
MAISPCYNCGKYGHLSAQCTEPRRVTHGYAAQVIEEDDVAQKNRDPELEPEVLAEEYAEEGIGKEESRDDPEKDEYDLEEMLAAYRLVNRRNGDDAIVRLCISRARQATRSSMYSSSSCRHRLRGTQVSSRGSSSSGAPVTIATPYG